MIPTKYDAEFRKKAVEKVTVEGMKVNDAAKALGLHSAQIYKWLRKAEGRPKRRRVPKSFKKAVVQRVVNGERALDVAKELNMPVNTVYNWTNKTGFRIRQKRQYGYGTTNKQPVDIDQAYNEAYKLRAKTQLRQIEDSKERLRSLDPPMAQDTALNYIVVNGRKYIPYDIFRDLINTLHKAINPEDRQHV